MNTRQTICAIVLVFAALLMDISTSFAWDNIYAHPFINTAAFDVFARKYLSNVMSYKYKLAGLDYRSRYSGMKVTNLGRVRQTTGSTEAPLTAREWLEHGGMSADEPEWEMALRHFYDPLKLNGATYLTDHVGNLGGLPKIDARTWALNHPQNVYSLASSLKFFKMAMENAEYSVSDPLRQGETVGGKREQLFAAALRGLGEVMHLVADMSNPAHVRNDSHPSYDMHETVVSNLLAYSGSSFRSEVTGARLPTGFTIGQTPEELFDTTARFVNAQFFSNETIMNDSVPGDHDQCDHFFNMAPANWEARYPSPLLHQLAFQTGANRYYYPDFKDLGPLDMVQSTYSNSFLSAILKIVRSRSSSDFSIPAILVEEQASILLQMGIHACAKMIDLFFPTLKVQLKFEQDVQKLKISGSVVHEIDHDPAWKALAEPIVYSGPARLMCRRGRRFAQVASLTFNAGKIDPEITVYIGNPDKKLGKNETKFPFKPADCVFIEIPGGGMIWRSPEEEIKIDVLAAVRACSSVGLTITCDMEWSDKETGIRQNLTNSFLKVPLQWTGNSFKARGKASEVGDGSPYSGNFIPKGQEEFTDVDCEGQVSSDGTQLEFLTIKINSQTFVVGRTAGTFAYRKQINEEREGAVQRLPWSYGTTYEIRGPAAVHSFRHLNIKSVEKLFDCAKDVKPPPDVTRSLQKVDVTKPRPDAPPIKVSFTKM